MWDCWQRHHQYDTGLRKPFRKASVPDVDSALVEDVSRIWILSCYKYSTRHAHAHAHAPGRKSAEENRRKESSAVEKGNCSPGRLVRELSARLPSQKSHFRDQKTRDRASAPFVGS